MTVRTPATARSRRTREHLAMATHRQLRDHGILAPDAIAEAADVSTATFYAHFASHDDAIAAALDISLASIVGVAEQHFHIEALIEHGLEMVVADLVTGMHEVFREENLVMRAAQARMSSHQPTRETYRGHEARSLQHLTRQIELGQKAGILRDGSPEMRATSLLVHLQGLHNPLLTKKRIDPVVQDDLHRAIYALLARTE
ncbi:MAG: TetR/AcrR family transcriptional regulator [Acidimicrobiales bacterium]